MTGWSAGADQPQIVAALHVHDNHQPTLLGHPDQHVAILNWAPGIVNRQRAGISEGGSCLLEANSVFRLVDPCLGTIPLEPQRHSRSVAIGEAHRAPARAMLSPFGNN